MADAPQDSLDEAAKAQVGDAAERLRTTARGTLAVVTGLGTTATGAIAFTGLADLDGARFWWGAAGVALIIICTAAASVIVAQMLGPTHVRLSGCPSPDKGVSEDMLLGAKDLTEFAEGLKNAEREHDLALRTAEGSVPGRVPSVEQARGRAALWGGRAERIRLILHFHELKARWTKARYALLAAALFLVVGVLMYQHAASDQRVADKLPSAFVKRADLIIRFTPGVLSEEARCAGARRGVRVPDTIDGQAVLLLYPKPKNSCPGALVRVADIDVTTTLAPVAKAKKP